MLNCKQNSYPIVTVVVFFLFLVGAFVYFVRPLIPGLPPSDLISCPGEFVQRGAYQEIPWLAWSSEVFARARQEKKPIVLVMSSGGSTAGRVADRDIFLVRDVIEALKQKYICVRIDLFQNPEFASLFLPLKRAEIGFDASMQIWILNEEGLLYKALLRYSGSQYFSSRQLVSALQEGYDQLKKSGLDLSELAVLNEQDHSLLLHQISSEPVNFERYARQLLAKKDVKYGGYPINDFQMLRVHDYRYLLSQGLALDVDASLGLILKTSIVDWLHGGFFYQANRRDWTHLEYDKISTHNAEIASLFADLYLWTKKEIYREIALNIVEMLLRDFWSGDSFFAYQEGDSGPLNRSKTVSFSLAELRKYFSSQERKWLARHLNLDPGCNSEMVVQIKNSAHYFEYKELYHKYFYKLRSIHQVPCSRGGAGLCYINGIVIARLLETCRKLDNPRFLEKLDQIFNLYRAQFRSGMDEVLHSSLQGLLVNYLADPLSFADAALEYYFSFGSVDILEEGFRVLNRAIFLYTDPNTGLLLQSRVGSSDVGSFLAFSPDLMEDLFESSSAMAIRLTYQYGVLSEGLGLHRGANDIDLKLHQKAPFYVSRLGHAAERMRYGASSFFRAAYFQQKQEGILCVGENGLKDSQRLERESRKGLIFPILRKERGALFKNLSEGCYRYNQGKISEFIEAEGLPKTVPKIKD